MANLNFNELKGVIVSELSGKLEIINHSSECFEVKAGKRKSVMITAFTYAGNDGVTLYAEKGFRAYESDIYSANEFAYCLSAFVTGKLFA